MHRNVAFVHFSSSSLSDLISCGGGTGGGGHRGTVPPFDFGILTLALWALHGKNGTKSRQCPHFIKGVPPPLLDLTLKASYQQKKKITCVIPKYLPKGALRKKRQPVKKLANEYDLSSA